MTDWRNWRKGIHNFGGEWKKEEGHEKEEKLK
jgi:hypothetical protein